MHTHTHTHMHTASHTHSLTLPPPQVTSQLDTFRKQLEQFASNHKTEIRKNAEFRGHFQQMCARIGVDPLACETAILY